jgi:hypothetical protein
MPGFEDLTGIISREGHCIFLSGRVLRNLADIDEVGT